MKSKQKPHKFFSRRRYLRWCCFELSEQQFPCEQIRRDHGILIDFILYRHIMVENNSGSKCCPLGHNLCDLRSLVEDRHQNTRRRPKQTYIRLYHLHFIKFPTLFVMFLRIDDLVCVSLFGGFHKVTISKGSYMCQLICEAGWYANKRFTSMVSLDLPDSFWITLLLHVCFFL